MSQWRRFFGVDLFDTLVHVGVTFGVLILVAEATRRGEPVGVLAIASVVLFSIRRRYALRRLPLTSEVSGETTTGAHRRLDNETRLQDLESLYARVDELEERLDFSERLLASKNDPARQGDAGQ